MRAVAVAVAMLLVLSASAASAQYLGNYTVNPHAAGTSVPRPPDTYGNPYGTSVDSPRLQNDRGEFRGNLNSNRYDPDSISNPYGHYGNPYSPDSVNNPYGQGNPYRQDSPYNPHGQGLRVYR